MDIVGSRCPSLKAELAFDLSLTWNWLDLAEFLLIKNLSEPADLSSFTMNCDDAALKLPCGIAN
jgi:hypothetical protein